jgi:hypothetical protein
MRRKTLTLEDVIASYKEQYKDIFKENGNFTPEEKEKYLYWMSLQKINKEIEGIKPIVMGGYPKFLYHALTPFYNIIAYTFILVGIALVLVSTSGFFISSQSSMIGYLLPSVLSLFFGIIIILFLRTLKVTK